MNQDTLADLLHVQRSVVSKYENGQVPLTDVLIRQLCEIYDVSTDYLLGQSDKREPTAITSGDIKFALFGDREIDDDVFDDVRDFARFAAEQKRKKQGKG